MSKLVRELQPSKARYPIRVTELGMLKLLSAVHLWKASSEMLVTESGMVTLSKEIQPRNAPHPMKATDLGSARLIKDVQ